MSNTKFGWLKRCMRIVICILPVVLSGCIVTSIYPWYHESQIVDEPDFRGIWTPGEDSIWIFEEGPNDSLEFIACDRDCIPEASDDDPSAQDEVPGLRWYIDNVSSASENSFISTAQPFKIGNKLYLDVIYKRLPHGVRATNNLPVMLTVPAHMLFRVEMLENEIHLAHMNEDWVRDAVRTGYPNISVLEFSNDRLVLTGETQELNDLLKDHASDANFWRDDEDDILELVPFESEEWNPRTARTTR